MTQRSNFFEGQEVSVMDMTHSQIALTGAIKARVSDYFTPGVVDGLTVYTDTADNNHVAVGLGTAYRADGERIEVPAVVRGVGYNNTNLNALAGTYTVVARYVEGNDGITGIDPDGLSVFVHILDSYGVSVLKSGTDSIASDDVRLTDVIVTVPGGTFIFDTTNRNVSEARVGADSSTGIADHGSTHLSSGTDPIPYSLRTVTSGNVTVAASDRYIQINQASSVLTLVTLPAAPYRPSLFTITDIKGDAALRPITVVPSSGTINGNTNFIMDANYMSADFLYNGSNYNVV